MTRATLHVGAVLALVVAAPAPVSAQESPAPSPSSPTRACSYVDFTFDRTRIRSGETVAVTAHRSGDGVTAELERSTPAPSALVRSDASDAPTVTWTLRLGESHELSVQWVTQEPGSCRPLGRPSGLRQRIDVEPRISIAAKRNAPRDYTFTGRVQPAKAQTVTLYRHEGTRRVITSQARVGPDGTYRIDRRFLGSGQFGFSVGVRESAAHLAGSSATRPTVIH
jgi:hypothetical protein